MGGHGEPAEPQHRRGGHPGWRREVLHVLADEILTPVTVLQGVVHTFTINPVLSTEQGEELVRSAQRASGRLRRLVEHIMLADDLCSGRIPVTPQPCSVEGLLTEAADAFPVDPPLRLVVPEEVAGSSLVTDRRLVARALVSVIDNALAFSPADEPVEVRATRARGEIHIAVVDRGPGIPEHIRHRATDMFVQGETGDRRTHRGLGVGLYIARAALQLLEGRLELCPPSGGEHAVVAVLPVESRA